MKDYLTRSHNLSRAKKEIQQRNDDSRPNSLKLKPNDKIITVLEMGMLSSNLKTVNITFTNTDDKYSEDMIMKERTHMLSFFKTPEIYIDHMRRMYTNSFKEFLSCIQESPKHFPEWKLDSPNGWRQTSIRLDLLESKYREF